MNEQRRLIRSNTAWEIIWQWICDFDQIWRGIKIMRTRFFSFLQLYIAGFN